MERRQAVRITVGFSARLSSDGLICPVVIEDLSERGIQIITAPLGEDLGILPGAACELTFKSLLEESLNLNCTVKWSRKTPPHKLTERIGMSVMNPPWQESGYFV